MYDLKCQTWCSRARHTLDSHIVGPWPELHQAGQGNEQLSCVTVTFVRVSICHSTNPKTYMNGPYRTGDDRLGAVDLTTLGTDILLDRGRKSFQLDMNM